MVENSNASEMGKIRDGDDGGDDRTRGNGLKLQEGWM